MLYRIAGLFEIEQGQIEIDLWFEERYQAAGGTLNDCEVDSNTTYLDSDFPSDIGWETYNTSRSFLILQFEIRFDLDDHTRAVLETIPLLVASPLHALTNTRAVGPMEKLVLRGTLGIREIAKRAGTEDGLVDGEVKLCECLLFGFGLWGTLGFLWSGFETLRRLRWGRLVL